MLPENTSKRDPLVHLMGMMDSGQTGYIEGMEAAGQRQFVASTVMPTECDEKELDALGFKLGDPVGGDGLFRHATLPQGWSKQGSDHSMWSDIVDEHGRRRVAIFYKAAFYDRRAFASVDTLYSYLSDVISGAASLVYDGEWATPEAVKAEAEKAADDLERHAVTFDEAQMPEAAARERADADRFRELAAKAGAR
jgi:hypothetical protein